MERQLWMAIVAVLATLDKPRPKATFDFSDEVIVRVFYWAAIHDRPTCWATVKANWPLHLRKRKLPSESTMSVRLRTPSVVALLDALEQHVIRPKEPGVFWIIDGKPLPISGCSKDRQAGFGRAAGGKAKGYKVHALLNSRGEIAAWRLAPMNKDERPMAERLLRSATVHGLVIADSNYDSNQLHEVCQRKGELQLLHRRRYRNRGVGHRVQSAGRLRCIALVENPFPAFAEGLLQGRNQIERCFSAWTTWGGGLNGLPPWVRTHRRVRRWVQAKLVLTALRRQSRLRTCVK